MFSGIWCCHIDHGSLESSLWSGSTKFLNQLYISSLGNFLILAEKRSSTTLVNSCVKCVKSVKSFHVASGRSSFFEFLFWLVPPFYFLNRNCYFSPFLQVLVALIYPLIGGKYELVYSLNKQFEYMGFRVPK